MSYSMSLLCGIKQNQLRVSAIELEIEQTKEVEDWDFLEMVIVYVLKMPNNGDYNSTPALYLLRNLGSNFYVQINDDNKDNSIMSKLNIFVRITNAFYLIFLLLMLVEIIKMIVLFII
jgi:hypothetical protein